MIGCHKTRKLNPGQEFAVLAVTGLNLRRRNANADVAENIMAKAEGNWKKAMVTKMPLGMKKLTVEIPDGQLKLLDLLVSTGLYKNREEAVQAAIKDLVKYHRKI